MNLRNIVIVSVIVGIVGLLVVFFKLQQKDKVPSLTSSPTPVSTVSTDDKLYSLEMISQHNIEKDCWMAISGKVYDVSQFSPKHPGGKEILRGCGKDATELFGTQGGKGRDHSAKAKDLLKNFEIGSLLQ